MISIFLKLKNYIFESPCGRLRGMKCLKMRLVLVCPFIEDSLYTIVSSELLAPQLYIISNVSRCTIINQTLCISSVNIILFETGI